MKLSHVVVDEDGEDDAAAADPYASASRWRRMMRMVPISPVNCDGRCMKR